VAGNLSAETVLNLSRFVNYDPKNGASCGYAIGSDGAIALGVEETNRSWTTSSRANDMEAITAEIANDGGAPDWHMSDKAINAWIDLSVDIAKFYGYSRVLYKEKPTGVAASGVESWIATWSTPADMIVTLHCWYANKACPGQYFIRNLPKIVNEINARLSGRAPVLFVGEKNVMLRSVLRKGSTGTFVTELQQKLNKHGAAPSVSVDSVFGAKTEAAVVAFQTAQGLTVDGVVGPATWGALDKTPAPAPTLTETTNTFKQYDVLLTAKALNIRKGPGTNYEIVKAIRDTVNPYTITDESNGQGASKWGRLKTGEGWIALDYTKRR
jgi:hypothetical protein